MMQIADSLAAQVDSLATVADSTLGADDSSLVSDSSGIGALGESVGDAVDQLSQGRVSDALTLLTDAVIEFTLTDLIPAVIVAGLFYLLYRILAGVLNRTFRRTKRIELGVQQLIMKALRLVIAAFAAVTVLGQLGINVTALVAGLGIAGIALGFAAQDTIQNFIAGVTILLDRPFRVGDNIELQDTFGTVDEITLRSTRIRTLNNEVAILPNAKVITEKIINHTKLSTLRIVIRFGIAYKESPEEARGVVLGLTEGDRRIHPDHAPQVVVTDLGDSSVNMELRLYLKDPRLEVPVRFEYQEKVFNALKAADIEIPFPHLQLFIDEAKAFEDAPLFTQQPPLGGEEAQA
ncbi:MAG: mechanosensitive ion channel family protein [Rhodothermaceae bacterium]|nr:mechanosensitive ion channel family protein [Rhodothermaceae bacterium]